MSDQNRRTFIKTSIAAATAANVKGANDRINVAVIGLRGRGRDHMLNFSKATGCRVAAICDIDDEQIGRGQKYLEKLESPKPEVYRDLRRVFDDKNIDAVTIATPNHWHVLATVWACQAGKDVYVEKPASHNIWESQQMVAAARKYNRMVQVGSQSRSLPHKMHAIQLINERAIGQVYHARALCFRRRFSIGHTPDQAVPPGLDWDLFLGPA